jgi:endonuclease/exonuclease/phosphatase family metal-dependent hydrolase
VPAEPDALARAPGTAVRVVAWNVADRTIRERPEIFARVLRALSPDVLLLDELPATTSHEELVTFLARLGDGWAFALGAGGGRQRAAVASRLPLEPAPAFERVQYPDSVRALLPLATFPQTRRDLTTALEDGISTAGAYVQVAGRRVLFVAVDLACCGGAESVEDRFRRIQADAVNGAARAAIGQTDGVGAIVVGGDLNLVGSRRPLEILGQSGPPVSTRLRLEPVYALQLDRRTAATWRQDGPFGPGRLDWMLYSPWSLAPLGAFVFESDDLSLHALSRLGVETGDSHITSDHLPVVTDFGWVR